MIIVYLKSLDKPSSQVREATRVANIAVFTALVVSSDLALSGIPNVKLDASIIFLTTLVFGVTTGASVAVLSELIWSQVTPWGPSGAYLLPFLVSGELLYVIAGLAAKRLLGGRWAGAANGPMFGGLLAIFTFAWDFWTNFATAILASNATLGAILFVEFNPGALFFNLMHEGSNLALGLAFVPAALALFPKLSKGLV